MDKCFIFLMDVLGKEYKYWGGTIKEDDKSNHYLIIIENTYIAFIMCQVLFTALDIY